MKEPLRVTQLIQQYYPIVGGAERQVADVTATLRDLRVDVQVITRRANQLESFARVQGTPVYRVPTTRLKALTSLRYTVNTLYLLCQLKPDLVHAHGLLSTARTALLAQRLLKLPIVITVHNLDLDVQRLERSRLGAWQLSALWRNVNLFVSVNKQIDKALARLGVPSVRRVVIPNGVDAMHFFPAAPHEKHTLRQQFGALEGPLVLFVGRLVPEKRIDNLLRAWRLIRRTHPQAQLWIVGEGPLGASLRELAEPDVKFTGQTQDVTPYLRMADVFVLPSATEGMSVALLEALATGLAVIATDVGGAGDVVQNGQNGLLVPPNDLPALADALKILLADVDQRTRMGRAGRETILHGFQSAVVGKKLLEHYQALFENAPGYLQEESKEIT